VSASIVVVARFRRRSDGAPSIQTAWHYLKGKNADGKAPTFVKFEGTLYQGGPIWDIDLAHLRWGREAQGKAKGY
jgi:hypothetical protein